MLRDLAATVGEACGCSIDDVWCTFTAVTAMTVGTRSDPADSKIIFVDLAMRARDPDIVEPAMEAAATTVSGHMRVPLEDAWVRFIPLHSGEVYAGGAVLSW
jgi:hypothetical protein